jgi:dinuclear metal center YbgI/SA1388 family protein
MGQAVDRDVLAQYLDELLAVSAIRDYCPNGLQVEGRSDIRRIVAGVTASQALLNEAVSTGADAVLVHHGYFWKGEDARLLGTRRQRIKTLLANDISLFAYHLPLDGHAELGNNAQLAKMFGWQAQGRFGEGEVGWFGEVTEPLTLSELTNKTTEILARTPLIIGDGWKKIRRIAWCSGGGDSYFEAAIALGVDAFFSGEISEPAVHLARESGVAYLACGHHATERYGVKALAEHLAEQFDIDCEFIDIDNPV